jgi:hypothetical protein
MVVQIPVFLTYRFDQAIEQVTRPFSAGSMDLGRRPLFGSAFDTFAEPPMAFRC